MLCDTCQNQAICLLAQLSQNQSQAQNKRVTDSATVPEKNRQLQALLENLRCCELRQVRVPPYQNA
jgi:hypothetical protein